MKFKINSNLLLEKLSIIDNMCTKEDNKIYIKSLDNYIILYKCGKREINYPISNVEIIEKKCGITFNIFDMIKVLKNFNNEDIYIYTELNSNLYIYNHEHKANKAYTINYDFQLNPIP